MAKAPYGYIYGWEKLYLAVRGLAAGRLSLGERLADAMFHNLTHIREDNLSAENFKKLEAIAAKLNVLSAEDPDGAARAAIAKLDDDELTALAQDIVDIFNDHCRECFAR